MTPSGIDDLQASLKEVERLSPFRTEDTAQRYFDWLERKKPRAAQAEGVERGKAELNNGSVVENSEKVKANEAEGEGEEGDDAENITNAGGAGGVAGEERSIGKVGCEALQ